MKHAQELVQLVLKLTGKDRVDNGLHEPAQVKRQLEELAVKAGPEVGLHVRLMPAFVEDRNTPLPVIADATGRD